MGRPCLFLAIISNGDPYSCLGSRKRRGWWATEEWASSITGPRFGTSGGGAGTVLRITPLSSIYHPLEESRYHAVIAWGRTLPPSQGHDGRRGRPRLQLVRTHTHAFSRAQSMPVNTNATAFWSGVYSTMTSASTSPTVRTGRALRRGPG